MLLQGSYFTAVDLAQIASDLDSREGSMIRERDGRSHNFDDSGFFSVQVSSSQNSNLNCRKIFQEHVPDAEFEKFSLKVFLQPG